MQYLPLGNTGLYVSRICLGTMTFGDDDNAFADTIGATGQELATRMVDTAIEAGVNFFDTANMYALGKSEEMLGKARPLSGERRMARYPSASMLVVLLICTGLFGCEFVRGVL